MFDFLNKSSMSFLVGFLVFIFLSVSFLVGVSVYAEAKGINVSAAIANFFK